MKILLLLLGLALGFWGFMVIIQGALGVGLLVSGAVFFCAACLGFWLEESAVRTRTSLEALRKLLVEIREQHTPPPPPVPAEFDAGKAVEAMVAARVRR